MTLSANEFMRRFLLHVLPSGLHRIRHYGLIANAERRDNLARARELLQVEAPGAETEAQAEGRPAACAPPSFVCPDCGAAMIVIDTLLRTPRIRAPPQLPCAP
jgi:hypothetical protein